jgi:hypothetical protein
MAQLPKPLLMTMQTLRVGHYNKDIKLYTFSDAISVDGKISVSFINGGTHTARMQVGPSVTYWFLTETIFQGFRGKDFTVEYKARDTDNRKAKISFVIHKGGYCSVIFVGIGDAVSVYFGKLKDV